jgi:Spy/CpxP family protein refolding chaperone
MSFLTIIKTNAMNYFSKNKVILWVLVFLVVMLVTALTSVIIFYTSRSDSMNQPTSENTGKRFNQELSLTPAQSGKVDEILRDYRTATEPVSSNIRVYRMQLLEELARTNPDTSLINKHLEDISNLQKQMQKASVKQYMALKQICTPMQCERLSSLYFELYGFQGQGKGVGKSKGMMHQYRRGSGQQGHGNQRGKNN